MVQERLKYEEMDDPNNLVTCENCQKKTFSVKWSEITRPPPHLFLCLNRFTFNKQTYDFTKEKTPVKIDEGLWIGGYEYELYHTIIHSGKDASSGHYYATGRRSEPTPSGDCSFYTMTSRSKKLKSPSWQGTLPRNSWTTTRMFFFKKNIRVVVFPPVQAGPTYARIWNPLVSL